MISILFLMLAAFFKAVVDTLLHHFDTSVFKSKNKSFWDPNVSWRMKFLPFTKYRPDAWHLSNSLMIICFVCSAVFHSPCLEWYWEVLIAGVVFNVTFNVFYNKVL